MPKRKRTRECPMHDPVESGYERTMCRRCALLIENVALNWRTVQDSEVNRLHVSLGRRASPPKPAVRKLTPRIPRASTVPWVNRRREYLAAKGVAIDC